VDHHVSLRHALGDLDLLALEPARGHGPGVATHAFGGFFFFGGLVGHVDELGTQRFDLFFDAGAHIRGFDHRAQALGGSDGLQAGHPDTEHHQPRGLDGASRRHEHGEQALVLVGGQHHGLVAGDVGLAREHVEALGARSARRGLEGEAGQAGLRQRRQAGGIEGVEHADQGSAGAHLGQLGRAGRAHLEHQLGPQGAGGSDHFGPDRLVGGVGGAGSHAGAALHAHAMTLRHQFFDRFGRGSDPRFACRAFGRNTNVHMQLLQLNLTIRACP